MECVRCGSDRAFSEAQLAQARENAVPLTFPPIPVGICTRCAYDDPAHRAEMDAWAQKGVVQSTDADHRAISNSLEVIDEFVEWLR